MRQSRPTDDVIVLAGGDAVAAEHARHLPPTATVIAADSGLAAAVPLGVTVDLVVGDLDSVDPADLDAAVAAGVPVDRHPVDKDRTDLAIAMDAAAALDPIRVTVVGGAGGRLDHLLANALLLASPAYAGIEVVAHMGTATVTVVRDVATLTGLPGELVSLLPVHGPARGVSATGLRFSLDGEDLHAGSSRGISNAFDSATASVRVTSGILLAVQPGTLEPTIDR